MFSHLQYWELERPVRGHESPVKQRKEYFSYLLFHIECANRQLFMKQNMKK